MSTIEVSGAAFTTETGFFFLYWIKAKTKALLKYLADSLTKSSIQNMYLNLGDVTYKTLIYLGQLHGLIVDYKMIPNAKHLVTVKIMDKSIMKITILSVKTI